MKPYYCDNYPRPLDIGCFWQPAAITHGRWGFSTFSPILYYGTDPNAGKCQTPTGRLSTEAADKNGHPCPKPLSTWTWLVEKITKGARVIDQFVGSGTTLVAARSLGIQAIGIEIDEWYCEIAAERLWKFRHWEPKPTPNKPEGLLL